MTSAELVGYLGLTPHPEGGFYKETYRSEGWVAQDALPNRFKGNRAYSTAIYFLLEMGQFSAFHRIQSDECWHHYQGGALEIFVLEPAVGLQIIRLGKEMGKGEVFQAVVPAGRWFASRPVATTGYALVGCTVAPGFDFADFEMARADQLVSEFPAHADLIRALCR
jgi:predicted cupin superfamily sugar epimerase